MILVFIRDLIFQTKIQSTAQALGMRAVCVRSIQDWERELEEMAPTLLIIDLNAGPDALEVIRAASTRAPEGRPAPRVIAFASHVDTEVMAQAKAAGAHEVMPRSRFSSSLPTILPEHEARYNDPA